MKLLLVDGNNLSWRGAGAAPLTYEGKRTEAIFVGLNMLRKHLVDFDPDKCIVVWDGGLDKERLRLYPDYKKKRRELTEVEQRERNEMFIQIKQLIKIVERFGLPQYQLFEPRREADDVIFSLICALNANEIEFTVASSDADFYQLFAYLDNIIVHNPIKKLTVDSIEAERLLGFPPTYYLEYKAMVGDASDNLPGVKGIGPVKAKQIISLMIETTDFKTSVTEDLLKLFDEEQFELMCEMIRFKHISKEELSKGFQRDRPKTEAELQERIMAVLTQYGFERHIERFAWFVAPFIKLWMKDKRWQFQTW